MRDVVEGTMPRHVTPPDLPFELEDEPPLQISYGRDILVVDDNQTNLVAIEAALAPLGRKLVLAHSGVEALARLLEQDFALIILDVAMPGMDGCAKGCDALASQRACL